MLTTRAQHGESRRAISEPAPGVVQGASKVVPAPAWVMAGKHSPEYQAWIEWWVASPLGQAWSTIVRAAWSAENQGRGSS